MKNTKLEWATHYASIGWSVFPCHSINNGKCTCRDVDCNKSGKHPRTKNGLSDATTDLEIINKWWKTWPDANIGCATGLISGIVALDLDAKHKRTSGEFEIPPTVCARSGGGGEHFLFRSPGVHVKSSNGLLFGVGVDVKADGGYIILAPSSHISGNYYEWTIEPDKDELANIPEWLIEAIHKQDKGNSGKKLWQKDSSEIIEGNRNETATSVAGKLRHSLPTEIREITGWSGLLAWNKKTPTPLSEKELRTIWESVKKYDTGETREDVKLSQANRLLEDIIKRKDVILFHDEQDDGFMSLKISDHQEIWPCRSKAIRKWLSSEIWRMQKKAPNSEAIKSILSVLEGNACHNGLERKLNNRMAWYEGNLWYDLTNKKWQAIKINQDGWEIVDKPPIIFRRYTHQRPQLVPRKDGDVNLLLKYTNITNDKHKLLLIIYLVSCFIPDFAHTLLIIFGSQGSAKSTLSKLLRLIIDPSIIEVASMPDNQKELIQTLAHHAFLFFDNVSYISEIASDTLCKAVTGGGFPKRELYSDDDDVIYSFKRCVGMNGINLVATRPDLLERSLLLELDRIDSKNRRQEKEIMDSFQVDLPLIIGGIFDVLVKAIKIHPTIKIDFKPRMADFAIWGCAIAEALGHKKEDFLSAYAENISMQTETALNENIVATAIISFMENKDEWKGVATGLLRELNNHAFLVDINTYEKYWPKASNVLMRKLNEIKISLRDVGINFICTAGKTREIILSKIRVKIDTDGTDDISGKTSTPLAVKDPSTLPLSTF